MFKFHADHYFHIGSAHHRSGKPCQDYATSKADELVACAIVSDGCSTGGNTDVGSRILTLATLQAIQDHARASAGALNVDTAITSIVSRQQQLISTSRFLHGLNRSDMLATCGYVYMTPYGGFVHLQGDGVIAYKYRNGEITMFRYEWDNNMPFYPAYVDGLTADFVRSHGGDLNAKRLHMTTQTKTSDGTFEEGFPKSYSLRVGLEGILLQIPESELRRIEYVAVFTDGVTQVDKVHWRDAVVDFLSFKGGAGEFAKRRMIKGIKVMKKTQTVKVVTPDGEEIWAEVEMAKGPVDDIAYAVVRIENVPIEEDKEDGS
jgi:hypothetical protein